MIVVTARTGIAALLFFVSFSAFAMKINVPLVAAKPLMDGAVSASERSGSGKILMKVAGGLDKPRLETQVFVQCNKDGIYFGFVCDDPDLIHAVTSATEENSAVFDDDSVQVLLAPSRDATNSNYYHFAVNAAGVKYSNFMLDDQPLQGWESATTHTKTGWEAEIYLPRELINGPDDLPYWRANVAREHPPRGATDGETSVWINPGISLHNPKRFGFLQLPSFVPLPPAVAGDISTTAILGNRPAGLTSPSLLAP